MDANKILRNIAEIRETLSFRKNFCIIKNVLKEPSLYTDKPRKSFIRRLYENLKWYIVNAEPCRYYNSYGFDIVDFRNQKEYIPYRRFRIQRNNENYQEDPFAPYKNQTLILRNKIIFASFFGQLLGSQYVIDNLGYIQTDGKIYDLHTHQYTTLPDLIQTYSYDLFVKKLFGECGDGCYVLNNKTTNLENLLKIMQGSKYLIQPRIQQHPVLNRLNSSCINTIRITTVLGKKTHTPHILAHSLRVGINKINDNQATGGLAINISPEGILNEFGVGHHARSEKHPITKVRFQGYVIPYFEEVKRLVLRAHALIPSVNSIGWDIAITPQGPVMLEGNDNWEISLHQETGGGLKDKWYEICDM